MTRSKPLSTPETTPVTAAEAGFRLTRLTQARLLFLGAATLSLFASVALWFGGSRPEGMFVGLWVPTILSAGAFFTAGVREDG